MSWGYVEVLCRNHPKAKKNGCVLEHRLIMEDVLGRYLKDEEVVHHINEVKNDNRRENLLVFRTSSDHSRFHITGILIKHSDGTYSSPEVECVDNDIICNNCQKIFKHKNINKKFCSDKCKNESLMIVKRPSKDELKNELISSNFKSVGKKYGVSDNAIRRWCRAYNMSTKSSDYK